MALDVSGSRLLPHTQRDGVIVFGAIALLLAAWKLIHNVLSARAIKLPPGPERNAFFGFFHSLPRASPWETLADWGNKFGNVIYLRPPGRPLIVLNSFQACKDLLDKRGAIYSDRPRMVFLSEMLPIRSLPFQRYGERWRRQRRMMQQYFNSRAVANFRTLQYDEAVVFLNNLLRNPEEFKTHIHMFTTATVFKITYGHDITSPDDPYVLMADRFVSAIDKTGTLGATLVDLIPALKYLPSWMPGGYFRKVAQDVQPLIYGSLDKPYKDSRSKITAGQDDYSLLSKLLKNHGMTSDATIHDDIKQLTGTMYRAGSLTSAASLKTFFLAMTLHPEAVAQAREEIDRVIGRDRLPVYEDRPSLPYIESIMKEVLRWHPPVPLGVPHRVLVDDEYNDMHIPAGSTILFNVWNMMHDPAIFPSPSKFDPSRFMSHENSNQDPATDPTEVVFGFGRRFCPGKWFAEASLFMAMSCVLATFDILPPLDAHGHPCPPPPIFNTGFSGHPEPFECRVVPRDERAVSLIESSQKGGM